MKIIKFATPLLVASLGLLLTVGCASNRSAQCHHHKAAVVTCKACGAKVKMTPENCPMCGKGNPKAGYVTCKVCGAKIKVDPENCPKCGNKE